MGIILELVTNRTQADVNAFLKVKAKINTSGWDSLTNSEKNSWLSTKGEYRYSDLNRVGLAVPYLAGLLNSYGYPVIVNPKTDWTVNDKPSPAQLSSYISDVKAIKDSFYGTTDIPATMDYLSYTDANNIELLLHEIESYIAGMIASFRICGNFNSGED